MRKLDTNILHICPPHLSDVATLPWEIQKKAYYWWSTDSLSVEYARRSFISAKFQWTKMHYSLDIITIVRSRELGLAQQRMSASQLGALTWKMYIGEKSKQYRNRWRIDDLSAELFDRLTH